ncbi:3-oxoacyl-[acyl-carrier-protein] reductase [Candidatus Margulisiibacteriota bacterium]
MDLKEQVAVVTGAGRGIGYAIASTLAQNKAKVIVADLDEAVCDKAAEELSAKFGVEALGIKVNVANFEDVQKMVETVCQKFGRIDILVNNAGITRDNLLLRMKAEEWEQVINVNLNSVFYCTKAVIRQMLKQKSGRIVNIASVVGLMGNPGQANYAAAKAGMVGFTKTVAKEFGAKGINCNAVAPGFIETDMIKSLPKEYIDNIIGAVPKRRLGSVQNVADLVAFLVSEQSSYITGQVINVDGGILM